MLDAKKIRISRKLANARNPRTQVKGVYSPFFEGRFRYRLFEDCLVLERVGIDYLGKSIKATIVKQRYVFTMIETSVPLGEFEIDEESTEDRIVIYF